MWRMAITQITCITSKSGNKQHVHSLIALSIFCVLWRIMFDLAPVVCALHLHSSTHAADVLQNFYYFTQSATMKEGLLPIDCLSGFIAAAVHDYGTCARGPTRSRHIALRTLHSPLCQLTCLLLSCNVQCA